MGEIFVTATSTQIQRFSFSIQNRVNSFSSLWWNHYGNKPDFPRTDNTLTVHIGTNLIWAPNPVVPCRRWTESTVSESRKFESRGVSNIFQPNINLSRLPCNQRALDNALLWGYPRPIRYHESLFGNFSGSLSGIGTLSGYANRFPYQESLTDAYYGIYASKYDQPKSELLGYVKFLIKTLLTWLLLIVVAFPFAYLVMQYGFIQGRIGLGFVFYGLLLLSVGIVYGTVLYFIG